MKKVEISSKCADDKTVIDDIYCVSNQIEARTNRILKSNLPKKEIMELEDNIRDVILFWTGNTYLGHRKSKKLEKAYNQFFGNLFEFLFTIKITWNMKDSECGLYQGKIYRVLGKGNADIKIDKPIEPEFNQTFVSWSKNEQIPTPYFKQKLYGPITKMEAELDGLDYGIDLEFWDASKNDEQEVVFPTIKDTVKKIEYIRYKEDEDEY